MRPGAGPRLRLRQWTELLVLTFVGPNFICYTFARGIHIQFLLWVRLLRSGFM